MNGRTDHRRRGLATGQMLGIIAAFFLLAFLALKWIADLPELGVRQRAAQARDDLKQLERELDDFYKRNSRLPGVESIVMSTTRRADIAATGALGAYTWKPGEFKPSRPMTDPFSLDHKLPYAYYAWPGGWLTASAGPDEKYDLKPLTLFTAQFDPADRRLAAATYDPSNGTMSRGDMVRIRYFERK